MKKIGMIILCFLSSFALIVNAGEITKDSKEKSVKYQVQYMMSEPGGL
ncbi:hypothetical protein [Bacillus cereus]|nr:hypothetical protein [Bacillus cereus]